MDYLAKLMNTWGDLMANGFLVWEKTKPRTEVSLTFSGAFLKEVLCDGSFWVSYVSTCPMTYFTFCYSVLIGNFVSVPKQGTANRRCIVSLVYSSFVEYTKYWCETCILCFPEECHLVRRLKFSSHKFAEFKPATSIIS